MAATFCGDGLAVGQSSDYVLTGAPASATGVALVSISGNPDFVGFGGTLLSFGGYFTALPVVSDAWGRAVLQVPGAPSPGFDLVMQSAFVDVDLPMGLTFSNATIVRLGQ